MNLITILNLLDKELIITFLYSIFSFIYFKILIFCILNINDDFLFFIKPIIIKTSNLQFSDSDSESESESESDSKNTSTSDSENDYKIKNIINKKQYEYIRLYWEYDIILKLFDIPNINYTIINDSDDENILKNSINILPNKHFNIKYMQKNKFYIINSFLFNINIFKKFHYGDVNHKTPKYDYDIKINDIYNLHKKIILLYSLNNNINSHLLKNLFPKYRYFYMVYTNNIKKYNYKLIDLHNNHDIIQNKKIIFNIISLN